jgi:PAS domain S-box-containing protein
VNRAAEKLTGYSREEIIGKDFSSFVAPEYADHVRENLYKKLQQEGETTYEVEVVTKDRRRVPVEVSSRLIYDEGVPIAVQGTARSIVERKRAEEALRGYSRQLIRAQEAERESISRELHDQIGQVLTAIRINLETIRDSSNRTESDTLIDEGVTIVDEAIQQVRGLSFELRPSLLDDLGLTAALRWYSDRYTKRTGIRTTMSICPESEIRLPRELETACFRIAQEALTNVARHAQARNVFIDVRTMNGSLSLSIKDDGVGFNLHLQPNGESFSSLGLRGMEERAHGLGGKLEIKSDPREGTEVRANFPNGTPTNGRT